MRAAEAAFFLVIGCWRGRVVFLSPLEKGGENGDEVVGVSGESFESAGPPRRGRGAWPTVRPFPTAAFSVQRALSMWNTCKMHVAGAVPCAP